MIVFNPNVVNLGALAGIKLSRLESCQNCFRNVLFRLDHHPATKSVVGFNVTVVDRDAV